MSQKQLIIDFLCSDYYKDKSIFEKYVHPKVSLSWNSTNGYSKFNYTELFDMVSNMGKSFTKLTAEISHAIAEDSQVAVRFTYDVETLEHPDSLPLAHFMSIWEIKDDKIFKIYLLSHAADENTENIISYFGA